MSLPSVVVVGAGFGGLRVARALRRAPVQVILLDRNNYHVLASATSPNAAPRCAPNRLRITDYAIIPLKERVVDANYDPVAALQRELIR